MGWATGRAEVAAVCRRNPDKLRIAQEYLGVDQGYTDWREMLDQADLDAVAVTTPHDLHYEQIKAALERGLHVLAEKPWPSPAPRRGDRRSGGTDGLVVQVVYGPRLNPSWRGVKRAIEERAIGALRQISYTMSDWRRYQWYADPPPEVRARAEAEYQATIKRWPLPEALYPPLWDDADWRHHPERMGGGMIANTGTHELDLALWLGGGPATEVMAFAESPGLSTEVCISAVARLASGALLTVTSADIPLKSQHWVIFGDDGIITIAGRGGQPSLVTDSGTEAIEPGPAITEVPMAGSEVAFVASVLDGAPNVCPARDGAHVVGFLEAMYRSIGEGRAVQVEKPH